jgi:hypothetical protein
MVENTLGLIMKDWAHFKIAFELAKSFFNFEKVFVVVLNIG